MAFDIKRWDGNLISEPGIYADIPIEKYHGDLCVGPSISSSGLRTIFHESPRAYFRTSYLNPLRREKPASKPFIFGRAAHHLLLGEKDFRKHFIVRPEKYPDTKVPYFDSLAWDQFAGVWKEWAAGSNWCKAWALNAAMLGLTPLTPNDIEMIRAMATSLAEEPLVQAGVLGGLIEHSFIWRDKETGIWLKWRPDGIPSDSLDFADLKTAESIDDEGLERAFGSYGYQMQGGLGAEACRAVLAQEMASFSLVYVEKEDVLPLVRVKQVKPGDIELGERCNRAALRLFARSVETGKWHGPGGEQADAEFLGLHPKAAERAEFRIQDIERLLAA